MWWDRTRMRAPPAAGSTKVQVVRSIDGETASADVQVLVNAPTGTFSGGLDPASDTGVSNTDGITSINQPTFRGTATPYAVVQLLARPQGQSDLVSLGQTVADPKRAVVSDRRSDAGRCVYDFRQRRPAAGLPDPGRAPVDEQPDRDRHGRSQCGECDRRSTTPPDPCLVPGQAERNRAGHADQSRELHSDRTTPPTRRSPHRQSREFGRGSTNDPQMVVINTNSSFPVRGLRIVPGGVRDVAGNPLNGLFNGRFPVGGTLRGALSLITLRPGYPRPNRRHTRLV